MDEIHSRKLKGSYSFVRRSFSTRSSETSNFKISTSMKKTRPAITAYKGSQRISITLTWSNCRTACSCHFKIYHTIQWHFMKFSFLSACRFASRMPFIDFVHEAWHSGGRNGERRLEPLTRMNYRWPSQFDTRSSNSRTTRRFLCVQYYKEHSHAVPHIV